MDKKEATREVGFTHTRISERFRNILYPVDIPLLLRRLPELGYVVPKKVYKGILEAGESLALKGNCEVLVNRDSQILGVEARRVEDAIQGFNELHKFWLEQLDPSPVPDIHFYEMVSQMTITSPNDPAKAFTQYWAKSNRLKDVGNILGSDVSNYGFRLVPANRHPSDCEWYDVQISPYAVSSANRYVVDVVWRGAAYEATLQNFSKIVDRVSAIIALVEG